MRRSIDSALDVVQDIVDKVGSGRAIPTVEEFMAAIGRFEQIEFDVPYSTDSDGFLFEYGNVNWFSEPTFTVSCTRQMEIVDADGKHEGYSHVQLEYRYRVDADLESLESRSSWWFRDSGTPFGDWHSAVKQSPIWEVIREKSVAEFDISQELA